MVAQIVRDKGENRGKRKHNRAGDRLLQERVRLTSTEEMIEIQMEKGCPQGSVLGPLFWTIYINSLISTLNERMKTKAIGYADDLIIIVEGNSRSALENEGQAATLILENWCSSHKMELSAQKSKGITFGNKLKRPPIIKINGKNIKFQIEVDYLGVKLDEKLNFIPHIKHVCTKGNNAAQKILRLAKKEYRIHPKNFIVYYKAIFEAICLYSMGAIFKNITHSHNKRKLQGAQRKVLLRALGGYSTTPLEALLIASKIPPIDITARARAATYWIRKGRNDRVREITGRELGKTDIKRWITET